MRIGMMVDLYKPHISGVTVYIDINRRYLESKGHEVYVFTFGEAKDYQDEPRVYRSPGVPIAENIAINISHKREIKKLIQTMDIVHVHHPFISGRLSLRYCRPLNIPIVFTNHTRYDLLAQSYMPHLPKEVSNSFLETYLPHFCKSVDLLISPSKGMADVLRALKVDAPITVIPNGVETARFKSANGQHLREKYGYSQSDILLVYSGRLAPEKNIPFLIKAFIGAAQAVGNVHLILLGKGPLEPELREMAATSTASDRIHFAGHIPYEEMPDYLNMCDVFVTASSAEVHPLSVIEAMAAGLPVLGIDSPGVGDTVIDGETGLLCEEDDLAGFTAKMTRLVIDHAYRKKMRTTARNMADQYSIERTGEIVLQHYEQLVQQAARKQKGIRDNLKKLWENFIAQ